MISQAERERNEMKQTSVDKPQLSATLTMTVQTVQSSATTAATATVQREVRMWDVGLKQ